MGCHGILEPDILPMDIKVQKVKGKLNWIDHLVAKPTLTASINQLLMATASDVSWVISGQHGCNCRKLSIPWIRLDGLVSMTDPSIKTYKC